VIIYLKIIKDTLVANIVNTLKCIFDFLWKWWLF